MLVLIASACTPTLEDRCIDDSDCLVGERCIGSICTDQFQTNEPDLGDDPTDGEDLIGDPDTGDAPQLDTDLSGDDRGDTDDAELEPSDTDVAELEPGDTGDVELAPSDTDSDLGDTDGDLGDTDVGVECYPFVRTREIGLYERCNPSMAVHSDQCDDIGGRAFAEERDADCSLLSRKDEIVDIPLENVRLDHSITGYLQFEGEDFSNGSVGPRTTTFVEPDGVDFLATDWGMSAFLTSHPFGLLPAPINGTEPATIAFWYHLCAGEDCPSEGGVTLFDTSAESDTTSLTVGIVPGETSTMIAGFSNGVQTHLPDAAVIATVANREWHHFALVVDGPDSIRLYHDGQFVGLSAAGGPFIPDFNWNHIRIGHGMGEVGVTPMGLDEVIVASRAFSAAEVRVLAESERALGTNALDADPGYSGVIAAIWDGEDYVAAPFEVIGARPVSSDDLGGEPLCLLSFDGISEGEDSVTFANCSGSSSTFLDQGADLGRFGYEGDSALSVVGSGSYPTGVAPDPSGSMVEGWFWFGSSQSEIWSIDSDISLSLLSTGSLNLSRNGAPDCVTEPAVQQGRWNHIAMKLEDSVAALYLNGVELSYNDVEQCELTHDALELVIGGISEATSFSLDQLAVSDAPGPWELRSRVYPELPTLRLFASTIVNPGGSTCPNRYPEYVIAWQPTDGVEHFVDFGGCDTALAACLQYAGAWDFETGNGGQQIFLDLSHGGNDLLYGTETCSAPASGTQAGASGTAASFPGDDTCFELSAPRSDEIAAFTLEALVTTATVRNGQTLLSLGGDGGRLLFGLDGAKPVVRLDDGHPDGPVLKPSTLSLSLGEWHHVLIAHEVGTNVVAFSVDGQSEVAPVTSDISVLIENYVEWFNSALVGSTGPDHTGIQYFAGRIDRMVVSTTDLSSGGDLVRTRLPWVETGNGVWQNSTEDDEICVRP